MTDAEGRTVTREHPEDVLLNKLEMCRSLRSEYDLAIWILGEIGYTRLAKQMADNLEIAADLAAKKSTETELGKPKARR